MRFYLHTGFGTSKTSYGGTHEEWLAGYGQSHAAAGPGFTAMSLLIVNAYLHDIDLLQLLQAPPPLSSCDVRQQYKSYPLDWSTLL
jgi:hypothetical protein